MFDLSEDHIYHFTSVQTAIEIIISGEFHFSKIERLNDINEIRGPEVFLKDEQGKDEIRNLLQNYRQISFTTDKRKRKGFDIPAMWGHYAENGRGVCLAFNKQTIKAEVAKRKMYAKNVSYSNIQDLNEILYDRDKYGSPYVFIKACKDYLFFHKTKDWKYEQEFRLITIDDAPANFSIKTAIQAIILFEYSRDDLVSSYRYKILSKLFPDLEFYRYKQVHGCWHLYDMNDNDLRPELIYNLK